jgi:hypothetical protein
MPRTATLAQQRDVSGATTEPTPTASASATRVTDRRPRICSPARTRARLIEIGVVLLLAVAFVPMALRRPVDAGAALAQGAAYALFRSGASARVPLAAQLLAWCQRSDSSVSPPSAKQRSTWARSI